MSRFYEALKQASQSLHSSGKGAEAEALDPVATLNEPETAGTVGPAALSDVEHASSEWQVPSGDAADPSESPIAETLLAAPPLARGQGFEASDAFPQNGSLGIETQAVFDQKARLIPNAAEPTIVEYYRLLRTSILQQQSERPFRSLLVTSPGPKEGKTITTLNLALACSMVPNYQVVVVDGDLRRGHLSQCLGIDGRPGIGNLLDGSAKLEDIILKSSEIPFYFVSRGTSELDPPELLHAALRSDHIRKLASHFDLTLVDSPPTSLVADPHLLAGVCDAIMFVVRAFFTSRTAIQEMSKDFQQFRIIGTVLNGSESGNGFSGYRSYYRSYAKEKK